MSMLYLWHPVLSKDKRTVRLVLTRGDSDRIGQGCRRFIDVLLSLVGVSGEPGAWNIASARCNYYGEYWQETSWESRWDLVWRVEIGLASSATRLEFKQPYIGLDEIDDLPAAPDAHAKPMIRFVASVIFSREKDARAAVGQLIHASELPDAGRPAAAPAPAVNLLEIGSHLIKLDADLGSGDEAFVASGYPDAMVASLARSGGRIHEH